MGTKEIDEAFRKSVIAIKNHSIKDFKNALKKKKVIESQDKQGKTLLHYAIEELEFHNNPPDIVTFLLDKGVNINSQDRNGWTPLHCAASAYHIPCLTILLERGANVSIPNQTRSTPLHYFLKKKCPDRVIEKKILTLLTQQNTINIRNLHGEAPLHIACSSASTSAISFLLETGANPNIQNTSGLTPLHTAILSDRPNVVKDLLSYGADPLLSGPKGDARRLAEQINNTSIIEILENHKPADAVKKVTEVESSVQVSTIPPKYQELSELIRKNMITELRNRLKKKDYENSHRLMDTQGRTLLHISTDEMNVEATKLLLEYGYPIDKCDKSGWTSLHCASARQHVELCRLLLSAGADASIKNIDGSSALHYFVRKVYDDAVASSVLQLFIFNGADVNLVNLSFMSPLHNAIIDGSEFTCWFLLHRGADPNMANLRRGETPAHLAVLCRKPRYLAILLKYGADLTRKNKKGLTPTELPEFSQEMKDIVEGRVTYDFNSFLGYLGVHDSNYKYEFDQIDLYLSAAKSANNSEMTRLLSLMGIDSEVLEKGGEEVKDVWKGRSILINEKTDTEEILKGLQVGAKFKRIRKTGADLESVILKYNPDENSLIASWNDTLLEEIKILEIEEIVTNYVSKGFEHLKMKALSNMVSFLRPLQLLSFSIIYSYGRKSLDLISETRETYHIWTESLRRLIQQCPKAPEEYMKLKWRVKNRISLNDTISIFFQSNYQPDKDFIKMKLETLVDSEGGIGFYDFWRVFESQLKVKEFEYNLVKFGFCHDGGAFMLPHHLKKFLNSIDENVSIEDCYSLIRTATSPLPLEFTLLGTPLDSLGFHRLLSSSFNSVFKPECRVVYQDMTQPISDYFISSSHNTYLEQDQLVGESSTEQYVRVLKTGCRCIELDCWNGPGDTPIITHGKTLTTRISLEDVCRAVRDYGFIVSEYPVILSIENHCDVVQQKKMAEIFKSILGDMLFIPPKTESHILPSPESLKRKVLIKSALKRLPTEETEEEVMQEKKSKKKKINKEGEKKKEKPNSGSMKSKTGPNSGSIEVTSVSPSKLSENSLSCNEASTNENKESIKDSKEHINENESHSSSVEDFQEGPLQFADEFAQIVFFKSMTYVPGSVEATADFMCSFSDERASELSKTLLSFTKKYLARIYPHGFRFKSSNYDPVPFWNCGSQLVALNFQTYGIPTWLNSAKFMDNGCCGYILKPEWMRSSFFSSSSSSSSIPSISPSLNPNPIMSSLPNSSTSSLPSLSTSPVIPNLLSIPTPIVPQVSGRVWKLHIEVLGARQLPKIREKLLNPFLKISIFGVEEDCAVWKSKIIDANGLNPDWNQVVEFSFMKSDLAFILFQVRDKEKMTSNYVAHRALSIETIRGGLRVVELYDKSIELLSDQHPPNKTFCYLYCKFTLTHRDSGTILSPRRKESSSITISNSIGASASGRLIDEVSGNRTSLGSVQMSEIFSSGGSNPNLNPRPSKQIPLSSSP